MITARYWHLWVRCPACCTARAVDLRKNDRRCDAAVTSLIPALSCRSCRPNAPFAELVRLSNPASRMKCGLSIRDGRWTTRRRGTTRFYNATYRFIRA